MAVKQKDIIDELLELVEDEFEGFAETLEELMEFVDKAAAELMDTHDVDIEEAYIEREVLKHVSFPQEMDVLCYECGDPDCGGCN